MTLHRHCDLQKNCPRGRFSENIGLAIYQSENTTITPISKVSIILKYLYIYIYHIYIIYLHIYILYIFVTRKLNKCSAVLRPFQQRLYLFALSTSVVHYILYYFLSYNAVLVVCTLNQYLSFQGPLEGRHGICHRHHRHACVKLYWFG